MLSRYRKVGQGLIISCEKLENPFYIITYVPMKHVPRYLTYSTDAPSPEMPHIKSRPDYSGARDLEFMWDISGDGADIH
jgi:hypothetical protein